MATQPDTWKTSNNPQEAIHNGFIAPVLTLLPPYAGRMMSALHQVALALDPVTRKAMSSSQSSRSCWIAFSILIALTASSLQASADMAAESECLSAANKQFKMQSIELSKKIKQGPPLETIEDVLVRRRLEEAYCNRFVECIEPSRAWSGPRFSRCLDLEAEERLRHVTK